LKHAELINQFREEISKFVLEVEASTAMGHFDLNKICENVFCGLFRELYDLRGLRNLNSSESKNFPGIDLADDDAEVAIQVTSDKSLDKIKGRPRSGKKRYRDWDRVIFPLRVTHPARPLETPIQK